MRQAYNSENSWYSAAQRVDPLFLVGLDPNKSIPLIRVSTHIHYHLWRMDVTTNP